MAIGDNNRSLNGNNINNSPSNNSRDNFKSNKQSTFDMFDINVKKAQKDINTVFDTAKSSFTSFERSSTKALDKIFDRATSRMKSFEKMQTASNNKISSSTISSYEKMYTKLNSMQANYSNSAFNSHKKAYDKVAQMWNNGFKSDVNLNIKSGGSKNDKNDDNPDKQTNKLLTGIKDIANTITDKLLTMMQKGSDDIVRAYNDTYSTVSVYLGMNQNAYQNYQRELRVQLKEMDLNDNVRISKVMTEMSDLAKQGLSEDDARNLALANTITKTIAPYIDTTTSAYQDLALRLGKDFTDNIAGMGAFVKDSAGSNRVFLSTINDVITKLEPMQLAAQQQLMSGNEMAMVEELVSSGAMTQSQAVQMVSEMTDTLADPYKALTSGNLSQKVAVATGNYKDPSSYLQSVGATGSNVYGSITNPLYMGAALSATGDSSFLSSYSDTNMIAKILGNYSGSDKSATDFYKQNMNTFASGGYDTQAQKEEALAENNILSVTRAILEEKFPLLTDIGEKIIGKLSKLITIEAANGLNNFISGNGNFDMGDISDGIKSLKNIKSLPNMITKFDGVLNLGKLGSTGNSMVGGSGFLGKITDIGFNSGAQNTTQALTKGFVNAIKGSDFIKNLGSGVLNLGKLGSTGNAMISGTGVLGKLSSIGYSLPGMSGASGLSAAALPLAGIGLTAAGGIMMAKDAFAGAKKSQEWLGEKTLQAKVLSAVGGALGGTGPGIGEGSAKDVTKNVLKNTGKWAALGAGIGTLVGGPIGTAIGGAIGAGIGALTGSIGGQRIAKAAKKLGSFYVDNLFGGIDAENNIAGKLLRSLGVDTDKGTLKSGIKKNLDSIKQNSSEAFSEIKKIWGDEDKTLIQKFSGTFASLDASWKNFKKDFSNDWKKNWEETKENWNNFTENLSKGWKNFTHAFTAEGAKENINKIKDSVKNYFSGASDAWDEAQENINTKHEEAEKKEQQLKEASVDKSSVADGSHFDGLNLVPKDGYLGFLHNKEGIFNASANSVLRQVGITGTSSGNTVKSILNKIASGGSDSANVTMTGDNSDVVKALEIATSKLIEAIVGSSSSKKDNITENKDNLLSGVEIGRNIARSVTTASISPLVMLRSSMPTAKES